MFFVIFKRGSYDIKERRDRQMTFSVFLLLTAMSDLAYKLKYDFVLYSGAVLIVVFLILF